MAAFLSGRKYIFAVLVVCLLLRIVFWLMVKPWDDFGTKLTISSGDSPGYHISALNMLKDGGFDAGSHTLTCIRTPGYTVFVAAHYLFAGPNPWVVLLSQCLVDTLSCLLLMVMVGMFMPVATAVSAGLFYALYPIAILNASHLLSDILFVFLVLLFSFFVLRGLKAVTPRGFNWNLVLAGISLGLATLVRPVSMYLPFGLVVLFLFQGKSPWEKSLRQYALFLFFFLVAVVPWMIRNNVQYGAFSLSTSSAYNLLILNAAPLLPETTGYQVQEEKSRLMWKVDQMIRQEGLDPDGLNDFQKAPYWKRYALQVIGSRPWTFAKNYFWGVVHTFTNMSSSEFALSLRRPTTKLNIKGSSNPFELMAQYVELKGVFGLVMMALVGGYYVVAYLCFIIGLVTAVRRNWSVLSTLSVLLLVYFVLITGAAGLSRFGLPAYPFVLVFSAMGAVRIIEFTNSRARAATKGG